MPDGARATELQGNLVFPENWPSNQPDYELASNAAFSVAQVIIPNPDTISMNSVFSFSGKVHGLLIATLTFGGLAITACIVAVLANYPGEKAVIAALFVLCAISSVFWLERAQREFSQDSIK